MYQVGDYVIHPGHGGCLIQAIGDRQFGGRSSLYYTLTPQTDSATTLYAPVEGAAKIGIRPAVSPAQADQVLHYYAQVQTEWISDHRVRKTSYENIVKTGSLDDLAKMVKELLAQAGRGKLNGFEKDVLPRASKKLFSELALAKGMNFEQVYLMAKSPTVAPG